jgi:hypothetical protein
MSKPPKGVSQQVTVDYDGRMISGTYIVREGMITVSSLYGCKTTQVDEAGSPHALQGLARIMLLELARDGMA